MPAAELEEAIAPTNAFALPRWSDTVRDDRPRERPTIIANPPGDRAFRASIEGFLRHGGRRSQDLEAVLRLRFPLAVVRPRALTGERFEIWYAYRDGHWIREEADGTP